MAVKLPTIVFFDTEHKRFSEHTMAVKLVFFDTEHEIFRAHHGGKASVF